MGKPRKEPIPTPGYWSVHRETGNGADLVYVKHLAGDRTKVLAEVFEPEYAQDPAGELLANAYAMAAANQLLYALEDAVQLIATHYDDEAVLKHLRGVIASAKPKR